MKDHYIVSGLAAISSGLAHGAAHYTFGNPQSFAAAGVSEVGAVVVLTSGIGTYIALETDDHY